MGPTLGPIIAPIISGWISMSGKWRWVFWGMSIINGIIAVLGIAFYRETFAPVLLKVKAKKLRKETGNSNLHTVFELTEQSFWKRLFIATSRPLTLLTTHPIIIGLGLYMAFVYGFLYIFIVAFPSLWETYYGYSVGISSLMYIGFGVGQFISIATWTPMVDWKFHSLTKANGGVSRPEFRIPLLIYSSFILAIGLFWYGWSAQARIMWLMPLIGVAIFGWGIFPVFLCVQNYLIDMNPRYAASSVGAAMVFRCLFGFGFPLFGSAMYDRLGYGWSNTLCGILCLILGTPFPLFIYKYGERVRSWTDDHVGHLYSK
jgi:MFS family permease